MLIIFGFHIYLFAKKAVLTAVPLRLGVPNKHMPSFNDETLEVSENLQGANELLYFTLLNSNILFEIIIAY